MNGDFDELADDELDDDEPVGDPWRQLALYGLGYLAAGAGVFIGSHHLEQPWRIAGQVIGLVLALAGTWCLLWFVGISTLMGLIAVPSPLLPWAIFGLLLVRTAGYWWALLALTR